MLSEFAVFIYNYPLNIIQTVYLFGTSGPENLSTCNFRVRVKFQLHWYQISEMFGFVMPDG